MPRFLEEVVSILDTIDKASFRNYCFVFPTRRACHYFRQTIADTYPGQAFILPDILTIEEFVSKHSGLVIPDELSLLVTLHGIFNERQAQAFDEFYPWGKMVLKDFEETDKYLVDAGQLFTVLKEHREVEEIWTLEEEDLAAIREFWDNVLVHGETEQKRLFMHTWEILGEVYAAYRKKLLSDGLGHTGMAYRELVEKLERGDALPYEQLVFAGFNALSAAEERIFSTCLNRNNTHLFWDADAYYLDDHGQEAGNFMRRYRALFQHPHVHWICGNHIKHQQGIHLRGIASLSGQAQEAAALAEHTTPGAHAAIVLCDEQLLLPLLFALPPQENGINITMGYPARYSVPYQLVDLLYHLYNHTRIFSGQVVFFHKHIAALLGHTGIQQWIGPDICKSITDALVAHNRVWAGMPWLEKQAGSPSPKLGTLFSLPEGGIAFGRQLDVLYEVLAGHMTTPTDRHICLSLHDSIRRFNAVLLHNGLEMAFTPYYKLLRQTLHSTSIPFEGSQFEALQIMGFLETRVLDFDEIIIMSANEQNLPAPNRHRSFIPYHLRKGFSLPTFEEQDAIYAYHFYRLLQRARKVHVLYNTGGSKQDNEPSRFVLQLMQEHAALAETGNKALTSNPVFWSERRWPERRMVIPKTAEIIDKLSRRRFSPSSLLRYLACPVQFYLHYIAKLDEEESIAETMDNRIMGIILHKAMELYYTPWLGKEVGKEDINAMAEKKVIEARLLEAFESELGDSSLQISEGKNHLIFEILKDIVAQFLSWDVAEAPFTIEGLEEKLTITDFDLGDGRRATLEGRIDRRDKVLKEGRWVDRVIDYKTGVIHIAPTHNRNTFFSTEEYMAKYFKPGTAFKEGFQGYMYALLAQGNSADKTELLTGFYSARRFGEGVAYVRDGDLISTEVMEAFRDSLATLLREILDPNRPFIQSDDAKAYEYSPFAGLVPL